MNQPHQDVELEIVYEDHDEDYKAVCNHLYNYNLRETKGLLKKPGKSINLFLRNKTGKAIGGIFCATYCDTLYIDNFWIDEEYRNHGNGKTLILQAESIASDMGCKLAHTSTFSYQAPEFYQKMGYEVFGILDEYPEGIVQYFLKKKL
ncbi:GNAT family N-acetyltransferase [Paenibacillus xylanilyticus]|uniref:GNAT family N-acetyltransferase n=1 Tax=Paenibacillus xylanilyticus TaxID=248903 RepID=A0A7Y6C0L9_9BACL|nr:GNAT family N-acetyltransferase [Paenibacillus xylanilyticus]NUU77615.1 GNAT family N-acetyltransferase [Paenibacillus xylanilyticus]